MAYNCKTDPVGIVLRTAASPLGPWSEPLLMFTQDRAFGHIMHAAPSTAGHDDGLSEIPRVDESGADYGPYLIPAWFDEPGPGLHGITYTLSTWNPYQVHLLRTVLAEPGANAEAPVRGADLPRAQLNNPSFQDGKLDGGQAAGDPFRTFQDGLNGDQWTVTTHSLSTGARATVRIWQEFEIDAETSTLSFTVHGGHADVVLYDGDQIVRRSRGRDSNEGRLAVVWKLDLLRGKRVRLQIEDNATDGWGFIGVSGFELK